jgi:hypothetical protein
MSIQTASLTCPKCGSAAVRRSHRTAADYIAGFFRLLPLRCRECRHRFRIHLERKTATTRVPPQRLESVHRRRAVQRREQLLYAGALLAFGVVVYFITGEPG